MNKFQTTLAAAALSAGMAGGAVAKEPYPKLSVADQVADTFVRVNTDCPELKNPFGLAFIGLADVDGQRRAAFARPAWDNNPTTPYIGVKDVREMFSAADLVKINNSVAETQSVTLPLDGEIPSMQLAFILRADPQQACHFKQAYEAMSQVITFGPVQHLVLRQH